ncbi:hypothetical protein J6590_035839 [Homalodisca vitripennis]|nr:hypothetical protein J6590_035839 [Homalodisca vitripennis]
MVRQHVAGVINRLLLSPRHRSLLVVATLCCIENQKAVFLIDSQAAMVVPSNSKYTNCRKTNTCRLSNLVENGWTSYLQWIPSHVGVEGNETPMFSRKTVILSQPPCKPHRSKGRCGLYAVTKPQNRLTLPAPVSGPSCQPHERRGVLQGDRPHLLVSAPSKWLTCQRCIESFLPAISVKNYL